MNTELKLAIVGSRQFLAEDVICRAIELYQRKYDDLIIVSGECPDGADYLGKKIALAKGIPYHAFPPYHRSHNEYCVLDASHYGKPYHVSNFFVRNSQIAEHCDHLLAFVLKGVKCNGTMDTYKKAKKLGKKVFKIAI